MQQSQVATSNTSPDMTTEIYGRFIKIQSNLRRKKLHRMTMLSSLKNHAENEVGRLAPDFFLFSRKASCDVKESGKSSLNSITFDSPQLGIK